MSELTIVQLYPDELGVAGDSGNVLALATRARRSGHTVEIVRYELGGVFPSGADIVVVGNGPISAIRRVHADLLSHSEQLRSWSAQGVPIFAYGAGAELLSESVIAGGHRFDGVGVFPFQAERDAERVVGYVVLDSSDGEVVGFADHATRWRLADDAKSFGTVSAGVMSVGEGEGVVVEASIATLVGGPVLPLNPNVSDALLSRAFARRGDTYLPGADLVQLDDYAREARSVIVKNVEHYFKRI